MYVQKTYTKVNTKEYCSSDKSKNDACWKIGDARRNIQQQKDRYVNNLKRIFTFGNNEKKEVLWGLNTEFKNMKTMAYKSQRETAEVKLF